MVSINQRVTTLENELISMKNLAAETAKEFNVKLDGIEATNEQILNVVTSAKTVSRFVRRWASPVIAAGVTAGFFNPKLSAFLGAIFG